MRCNVSRTAALTSQTNNATVAIVTDTRIHQSSSTSSSYSFLVSFTFCDHCPSGLERLSGSRFHPFSKSALLLICLSFRFASHQLACCLPFGKSAYRPLFAPHFWTFALVRATIRLWLLITLEGNPLGSGGHPLRREGRPTPEC